MRLTLQAARNMAAIILSDTQGADRLKMQQPLIVSDLNDRWLVRGTPYKDEELALNYCQFYIIFQKASAEIIGLGSEASMNMSDATRASSLEYVTKQQLDEAFGPRSISQLDERDLEVNLNMNEFLYGGLINKRISAVNYGYNLIQSSPNTIAIPATALSAEEIANTWHINHWSQQNMRPEKLLTFSRLTGRILSGVL